MKKTDTTCFKVSDTEICPNCKSKNIIKNGFTKNRKQQYYCKNCQTRSIDFYSNKAYCKKVASPILGVYYSDLIPVLIKATQEQQLVIEHKKEEIELLKAQLKNQYQSLLERIKKIENR